MVGEVTEPTWIGKEAELCPAEMVSDVGTGTTDALLELRLTTVPPDGAAAVSCTASVTVAPLVRVVGVKVKLLTVGAACVAVDCDGPGLCWR